jgi:hypothetical protein
LARRSSSTFQKRQRELAKIDKRKDKLARREQRRAESDSDGTGPPIEAIDPADVGLPELEELVVPPKAKDGDSKE